MHPILLKLGPITVYSYGVMVAIGFGISTFLIYRRAKVSGIDADKVIDIAIAMIISGIIGARFFYILSNLKFYVSNPIEILELSKGGLVWYGGFLSALVTLIIYIRKKSLAFWTVTDLIAPYIALAQAFGRIGCFLNGCCYGPEVPKNFFFAVTFPGEHAARLPTQLISSISLFIIYLLLRRLQDKKMFAGGVFLAYCILYPLYRFLVEFLRADNPRIFLNLTISQLISIAIFLPALAFYLHKALRWRKKVSNLR
jgi:phosphatidylglycerol---prolipoprotein diacylglyceryl transferase